MMKRIHIFALVFAVMCAASCNKNELRDEFVQNTDKMGLSIKSETIFDYSPETCQIGYMPASREFRLSDDRMSEYVILTVEEIPEVGDETTGTLTFTTPTNIVTKTGLHLKLVKEKNTAVGNMLWFWNKKNSIGVVVTTIK